jgi:probable HAF family extracellular repeat protein
VSWAAKDLGQGHPRRQHTALALVAASALGQIVGFFRTTAAPLLEGFFFDPKLGIYVTLLDPLAVFNTIPNGINDADQIVGSYDSHGFLFSRGVYTTLDDPAASATGFTEPHGINNLGQIVGTYQDAHGQHGFLYSGGTYTNFDVPSVNGQTYAYGINDAGQIVGSYLSNGFHGFLLTITPNPPPPGGTTADMILRHGADGQYEIYDIGNNSLLAAYRLGTVGTDWKFVGLGGFFGSDTSDMILRNSSTGGFEVYDIGNNLITNAAFLGAIGQEWQLMGFGNFSSLGETDMMLRNMNTGGVEICDISNNQITSVPFLGTVGLTWQFSGVGNFSSLGESDLLLRDANTGALEVYDIANNAITNAALIGAVGVDWQFSGVGNFSGNPGETDLFLRNSKTGGLEVYDIANNQLTGAAFIGTVGLDWQFAGIAPVHAPGASDLVLRNVNTGAFEVYDIAGNQLIGAASLGQVGLDWQLGGFAADPPTVSGTFTNMSNDQLVQAMAGFGGGSGAGESSQVPQAEHMQQRGSEGGLFDHLVGAGEQRRRNFQIKFLAVWGPVTATWARLAATSPFHPPRPPATPCSKGLAAARRLIVGALTLSSLAISACVSP